MFSTIALCTVAAYLLFFAIMLHTKNILSAFIFKIIPAVLAVLSLLVAFKVI